MNVALFVAHGHSHCSDLAEVEVHVMLMVVGGDPAHPHAAGLLASEDPHGVIVLERQRGDQWSGQKNGDAGLPWDSEVVFSGFSVSSGSLTKSSHIWDLLGLCPFVSDVFY